ncbi:hypothetical protein [Spongiactinospora sp. TRM90649]|uniref:hypothetical protein n=1 Tax=Spongiactinospora sp. TRM90649 TaxID=3031114 RepID=UPI0023F61F78|nr:hypothetical protein [Spongiactinospora sp. TRM90649]MDF5751259.1 hypothetical protein [Spongiactinospora sp. TRM90649]
MSPRMPRLLVLLAAGSLVLSGAGAASAAAAPPPGPKGESFQNDRTVGVKLWNSQIVLRGDGLNGKRGDGYRLKRPCWYEPGPDGKDMLQQQEQIRPYWFQAHPDGTEEEFQEFLKQFKDQEGKKGRWWVPSYNEKDPNGLSCWGALDPFVWAPEGETPPNGITAQELADIARAALTVPEPKIMLNPNEKSYVNLGTWVWLGVDDPSRSVTAELPGVMSATVTATLDEMEIDPGTTDTQRYDLKSECGPTGHPYVKGGKLQCGVIYRRASVDLPRKVYELSVTTTWQVDVETDGGPIPVAYQPIAIEVTRDVPVGEVQSTVTKLGD